MKYLLCLAVFAVASGAAHAEPFDHSVFDRVLSQHVDATGYVDYEALKARPSDLEMYVDSLGSVSPQSHPDRFPAREDALAYWINAYNALTIKGVIAAYPVASVKDIKILSGFFNRTRHTVGSEQYTLNDIEHNIIRAEFGDPRIHAAINCASVSCPRLENRAFVAETLDERLDGAMRFFLNEDRNVRLHSDGQGVTLSKILSWFEEDFTGWLQREQQVVDAQIVDYVVRYLPSEKARRLKEASSIKVDYLEYDWGLNDQKTASGM